jgi:hypothetical protein
MSRPIEKNRVIFRPFWVTKARAVTCWTTTETAVARHLSVNIDLTSR